MTRQPHLLLWPVLLGLSAAVDAQIVNSGFEDGFTSNLANGWSFFKSPGYSAIPLAESNIIHGGARAQRIELPQPAGEGYAGIFQVIDTAPGQLYRIDFWFYSSAISGEQYEGQDLEVFMGFDTAGRNSYTHTLTDFEISWIGFSPGRTQWRRHGREFLAGGSRTTIFYRAWRKFAQHGGSFVVIDDLTITPVSVTHPPSVGELPPPQAPELNGPNLLNNPDFEAGFTAGVAHGWTSWIARGTGSFKASTNRGKIGGGHYNPDGGTAFMAISATSKVAFAMPPAMGALSLIKSQHPEVVTIGRLFIDEINFWAQDDAGTVMLGRQHADNCFQQHLNYPGIDAWQGYNEPWVQQRERMRKTAVFELAFAERCHELGIRACSLNLAVGNPGSPQIAEMLRDVLAVTDFVGYHAYGGATEQLMNGPSENEFVHRWRGVKAHYDSLGWRHPAVIYTESGTYYGWKGQFSPGVVAADYIAATVKMMQDGWLLGHTIFTVGGFGIWNEWDVADDPIFTQQFTAWNLANPIDSRGGKAQVWSHDGSDLRGGVAQAVATTAGDYWFAGWFKYETGPGGNPVTPAITFRIGYDPTGQTSNGNAATIVWSADQIASRHLNSHIWQAFGVPVTATGGQTSVWVVLDQVTTKPTGRIYLDALSLRAAKGTVPPDNHPPVAIASAVPLSGTAPLLVSFSGSGSSDADNDPLTYSWSFGDGGQGAGLAVQHTYTTAGNYQAVLTASDGRGGFDTAAVQITVLPPVGSCTNGEIVNGGFESNLAPWVTFGNTDGIIDTGLHGAAAHGGVKMFGADSNGSIQNGGAYQRIEVCEGASVSATAWIYTRQIGGINSDVNCRLGIDPTGGTSAQSSSIIWTNWTNSQTAWAQIGLTGAAGVTAQGPAVTVFLEHQHKWTLALNYTLFDDVQVTATGGMGPPQGIPGDFDGDGDVDHEDFGRFQACYTGPDIAQPAPACVKARLDTDADVDLDDFGLFQACISGPGMPGRPGCASN